MAHSEDRARRIWYFSEGGCKFLEEPKGKVESDDHGCEGSPKRQHCMQREPSKVRGAPPESLHPQFRVKPDSREGGSDKS